MLGNVGITYNMGLMLNEDSALDVRQGDGGADAMASRQIIINMSIYVERSVAGAFLFDL